MRIYNYIWKLVLICQKESSVGEEMFLLHLDCPRKVDIFYRMKKHLFL